MGDRFVRPATVRLPLADVARRAHEAQQAAHQALLARVPPVKPEDLEASEARVAQAAQHLKDVTDEGAWILVKKRLTYGEQRAAFGRRYRAGTDGRLQVDPINAGMVTVTAYLVDWSLTDDDGQPVPIRGLSVDELTTILDNLAPEAFAEIREAIEMHEVAQATAQTEAKKKTVGTPTSAATSASPSAAGGDSTGSAISPTTSGTS